MSETLYPRIGKSKANGQLVEFSAEGVGKIVRRTVRTGCKYEPIYYDVGYYSAEWDMDAFEDYAVTATLTSTTEGE